MDNPLVSILIPNYNKEPYLRKTLDSVFAQIYTKWECIIVDDHSTDNSWEILEEYVQKDSRFRIYKRPEDRKQGGNAARNYAIEISQGDYVAFLDSDDFWNTKRLELAMDFLTNDGHLCIYSGAVINQNGYKRNVSSRAIGSEESVFDFILRDDTFCQTSSFIIHRSIAQQVSFDEEMKRHQDWDFFIRVHQISPWIYFENYEVEVNWSRPNLRKINFQNCIPFYERHARLSKNENVRLRYILRITSTSVRENLKYNVSSYFREVVKSEGIDIPAKAYILFYFPYLFWFLSKMKWLFLRPFGYEKK